MSRGDEDEKLQRLVDKTAASSPGEARLRNLVQASAGVEVSDAARAKIYASVVARRQPRRRASLRPAVVFAVLLVAAGATAAATLGHRWMQQRRGPAPVIAPPTPVEHRVRPALPRHEEVVAPGPVELPAPETRRTHAVRARPRSEDPSAVVMALEALRKQHDPDRAARLLAGYLAAHPEGALAEEALALSIEAAVARHDPAATDFAKRYLRAYPNGRFRQTADAALTRR